MGVGVHDDPNPLIAALESHRESEEEILDTLCRVQIRTIDRLIVPIEAMPAEKVNNGVLIVGALDEQPIGAVLARRHQRTSR
jgi:hypothetical protein